METLEPINKKDDLSFLYVTVEGASPKCQMMPSYSDAIHSRTNSVAVQPCVQ